MATQKDPAKWDQSRVGALQAIVDSDPEIQAALRGWQAAWNVPNPNANKAERDAAKRRLDAALNRHPDLKAAKVAQGTVGTGFQLNRTGPNAGKIEREHSDWGHVIRDMILPAAGIGAIAAAPAIIGSQVAAGGGGAGSGAGAGAAAPLASSAVPGAGGAMLAGAPTIGGVGAGVAAPVAGTSLMGGSLTAPSTMASIQSAGYAGGAGGAGGLARMAGQGLGAIGQGQAQNRGVELGGQFDLERLLMDRDTDLQNRQVAREREGREGGMDAWKRLLMAERTLSPGPRPQLSRYSIAPRTATGAERTGAEAMSAEVLARLLDGNPIAAPSMRPLEVDRTKFKPGAWERIAGYAAPIATAVGSYYGGR